MSDSNRDPGTNRHHGGPGSSHQRPDLPDPTKGRGPKEGGSTNGPRARVSTGGGEQDSHHTHDPKLK
jgi:hypothetical protein